MQNTVIELMNNDLDDKKEREESHLTPTKAK